MADKEIPTASQMRELFEPILTMQAMSPETIQGRTVGEGLELPDADHIIAHALPMEAVGYWKADTIEWVCEILQPQWLPLDLYHRLFALRSVAGGEDAFIGGWKAKGRRFQVVVTSDRVHILTKTLQPEEENIPERDQPDHILALAYKILRLPQKPDRSKFLVQPFRGLILGDRVVEFARDWHESLQFLSDGSGVKFSILKYKGRTNELQAESPRGDPIPWFQ